MFGYNVFMQNSNSVANTYKSNQKNFFMATQPPKNKKYTSLNVMLKECPFLGATKFGDNFIA
jgi:hypothetical protein